MGGEVENTKENNYYWFWVNWSIHNTSFIYRS